MGTIRHSRFVAASLLALAIGSASVHAQDAARSDDSAPAPAETTAPAASADSAPATTEDSAPARTTDTTRATEAARTIARLPDSTCERGDFRLILDVGHTVESPGADSARGAPEYRFNLNLTREIERHLREAGFTRTSVLVTPGKARPSLARRIAKANALGADLFLSIHHDSVPQKFKSQWVHEGRKFSFSDRFRGHSIFISHENPDRAASMQFGRLLGLELKMRGMTYTPHYKEKFMGRYQRDLLDPVAGVYRFDKLLVLKQTNMPAVLFEAGNIVNRDEELDLLSEERQGVMAAAVTQAVDGYCVAHKPTDLIARRKAPGLVASSKARKPVVSQVSKPHKPVVSQASKPHKPVAARKATARHAGKRANRSRSATLDAGAIKRR